VFAAVALTGLVLARVDASRADDFEDSVGDDSSDAVLAAGGEASEVEFTGGILPVFYVRDVLASVAFWRDSLGFECHHFYDYESGGSVKTWTKDIPAIYAEMRAGPLKFAIHRANPPDSLRVGGMIHYFEVTDVYRQHEELTRRGVRVGELQEKPWMNMFEVTDPDGHRIFFFTRPPGWEE
jgi:catechol 2,3-dioxygenase-like lactoylglutathione lyase family enzyme